MDSGSRALSHNLHVTGVTLIQSINIGSQMNFHSIRCIMKRVVCFYIPEPLARGYKTHNEFHNTSYGMKIHLRFFLSHELTRNEQITR